MYTIYTVVVGCDNVPRNRRGSPIPHHSQRGYNMVDRRSPPETGDEDGWWVVSVSEARPIIAGVVLPPHHGPKAFIMEDGRKKRRLLGAK